MCHRVLFGTSGTMANLPLTSNILAGTHGQHHNMPQIDPTDPSRNLSLIQYVDSKLPNAHLPRQNKQTATSAQALQQYFANQQAKYEVRSTRNVHLFDEKLGNINSSQNGSRNGRYPQTLHSSETYQQQNRYLQSTIMPQIAANFLPKTSVALDPSLRNKSANTMARQRTGGGFLISCDSNVNINNCSKNDIVISGSAMSVRNRLKSLCDVPAFERFKRLNIYKTITNENILSSTSK